MSKEQNTKDKDKALHIGDVMLSFFKTPKDWIEDAGLENGCYTNTCTKCKEQFTGHKRRFICKECFKLPY